MDSKPPTSYSSNFAVSHLMRELKRRKEQMSSRPSSNETNALPRWIAPSGIDLSLYPIDGVLRQALSSNDDEFRSGCTLLKSMCGTGRLEAGVFLLGLLSRNAANYSRLTQIADALASYPSPETVSAFYAELRRVRGSSATRAYLRRSAWSVPASAHRRSNLQPFHRSPYWRALPPTTHSASEIL